MPSRPYRHCTPERMVGRREGYIRVLPGREKFLALYYLRHVSFPTFPASTYSAATATVLSIIVHSDSGRRQSPLVGPRKILLLFRFHRSSTATQAPPLQTPLEGKTFSSGRWVEIHYAIAVLFATRARNIFIRSHALPSPSVTTIRLYHAHCPFVRFV